MSRSAAIFLLILTLVGCRGSASQGPVDPFLGPTRVPAPSTGSVFTPPPESYYYTPPQNAPQQYLPPHSGAVLPSIQQTAQPSHAGASPGAPSAMTLPPEGWSATPSFAGASLVAESSTPDLRRQPPPPAAAGAIVHREPIIRILEPPPRPASLPAAAPHSSPPTRVVNIVDLPQVAGPAASGFRVVSGTEADSVAAPVVAAVAEEPAAQFAPAAGNYGFDPAYTWLRGRLEYSQVDRRWKLRYIPVDGATDQHGGSVVIANEAALAGAERGEFVAVRGRIAGTEDGHGFAPLYEVTALQRLSRQPSSSP